VPGFESGVMDKNEPTRVYIDHEGILMREFRSRADTSMPQFVKLPVANRTEFEAFASERLAHNRGNRFPEEWRSRVASGRLNAGSGSANVAARDAPRPDVVPAALANPPDHPRLCRADRWGGFFGSLRNMKGLESLCQAF